MVAVKGHDVSRADGVTLTFCGAEKAKELADDPFVHYYVETGQSEVCISVKNATDTPVRVDRRRVRLSASGYRGAPTDDGQERKWTIAPHSEEELTLTYQTDRLEHGDRLTVSFKDAVLLGDEPVELAPLRLRFR